MITVTAEAAGHLRSIAAANEGKLPRLSVAGGGCAGFKYEWDLITKEEIDDMADEVLDLDGGGTLVLDGLSLMYLYGAEIKLNSGLFGTTLEVANPQAQAGCGCGESVNFDMDMVEANMHLGFQLPD